MTELSDLQRRVAEATGPNGSIDADLELLLDPDTFFGNAEEDARPYTASIDAALALVERVMPDWGIFMRRDADGCNVGLTHPKHHFVTPGCAQAATLPLSVLAALLSALQDTQQPATSPPGEGTSR